MRKYKQIVPPNAEGNPQGAGLPMSEHKTAKHSVMLIITVVVPLQTALACFIE